MRHLRVGTSGIFFFLIPNSCPTLFLCARGQFHKWIALGSSDVEIQQSDLLGIGYVPEMVFDS